MISTAQCCPSLHPAGDGRDQRGALSTAVLRLVERHLTLGGQILQRLLHDSGETTQRGGEEMIATFPLPPPSSSLNVPSLSWHYKQIYYSINKMHYYYLVLSID